MREILAGCPSCHHRLWVQVELKARLSGQRSNTLYMGHMHAQLLPLLWCKYSYQKNVIWKPLRNSGFAV